LSWGMKTKSPTISEIFLTIVVFPEPDPPEIPMMRAIPTRL
jgi:hypothetical protein